MNKFIIFAIRLLILLIISQCMFKFLLYPFFAYIGYDDTSVSIICGIIGAFVGWYWGELCDWVVGLFKR